MYNQEQEEINFEDQTNEKETKLNMDSVNRSSKIGALIFLVFLFLWIFINMPIISPKYASGIIFITFTVTIFTGLIFKNKKIAIGIFTFGMVSLFVLLILSSPLFRANDYYELIGEVEEYNYYENTPEIDEDNLIIVDQDLAEKLGDKVLGETVGLGSQYTIGEYYLVETADDIVWVAPLEPLSFWKWLQNPEGSPGYVYVSATDPNDVRLVQEIDGEPIYLKYTNDSYFMKDIQRHVYFNGFFTKGLTDYSFEIDDEGYPYWVITVYEPQIGLKGNDTIGLVIVDAQTGDLEYYDNEEDIPDWVSRVHPTQFITEQINYWGSYKNGFFNTLLAQEEMIQTTGGHSYVYIDDEPYYYTGLTSVQSDESTVGFMIVNLRTKDATFYTLTGATETAAQSSAEGQVQQYGYYATYPMLLNVYDKPTYFMTLKDSDGLVKQYAFVSVENYNIVGVGTTIEEAKSNYHESLKNNGTITKDTEGSIEVSGEIERINYVEGLYYIKLKDNDTLFTSIKEVSPYLPITQPGDSVTIEYLESENEFLEIIEFENKTLE